MLSASDHQSFSTTKTAPNRTQNETVFNHKTTAAITEERFQVICQFETHPRAHICLICWHCFSFWDKTRWRRSVLSLLLQQRQRQLRWPAITHRYSAQERQHTALLWLCFGAFQLKSGLNRFACVNVTKKTLGWRVSIAFGLEVTSSLNCKHLMLLPSELGCPFHCAKWLWEHHNSAPILSCSQKCFQSNRTHK